MFHYHYIEQTNSCVMIADFESGNYRMSFQLMEGDNGRRMVSFAQNQIPDNDIREEIRQWIAPLFDWHHVMNLAREPFLRCLNRNELTYTRIR